MTPRLTAQRVQRPCSHISSSKNKPFNLAMLTALSMAALLASAPTLAAIDDATVLKLIKQVEALTEKVDKLENADKQLREENIALRQQVDASSKVSAKSAENLAWTERVTLKGDMRYRYENIDDETKASDRNRSRVRARIEVQTQINNDWMIGLGLASGSDNPTSTNQTLGAGGSSKGINLDLAYFDYSGFTNTHVIGGKFKTPFYRPGKNGLIWDGDYRPEGLAVQYDNGILFANGAYLYLESDNKAGDQDAESIWGAQFGLKTALNDTTQLIVGLSYYDFSVADSKPFFDDGSFGNTLVLNGADMVFLNDYRELELFSELTFKVGDLPASVFFDWVENQDASDNETAWAAGAQLGKAKNPGTWQLAYIYEDIEADAVFGLTTESDFSGGGTNGKGHVIRAVYALDKNVSLALNYFMNEDGDLETDYDRLQMDLKLKY